jgi:hypothetical protein
MVAMQPCLALAHAYAHALYATLVGSEIRVDQLHQANGLMSGDLPICVQPTDLSNQIRSTRSAIAPRWYATITDRNRHNFAFHEEIDFGRPIPTLWFHPFTISLKTYRILPARYGGEIEGNTKATRPIVFTKSDDDAACAALVAAKAAIGGLTPPHLINPTLVLEILAEIEALSQMLMTVEVERSDNTTAFHEAFELIDAIWDARAAIYTHG